MPALPCGKHLFFRKISSLNATLRLHTISVAHVADVGRVQESAKARRVLDVQISASDAGVIPLMSDTASPTATTHAGRFCLPRCGTGARNGASVSTSKRSSGH